MGSKSSLICLILLVLPLLSFEFDDGNVLTASDSLSPSFNRTLVSSNNVFVLGFFSFSSSNGVDRWYLGIWYKSFDSSPFGRTYVWVANRDKPLTDSNGSMSFSGSTLVIRDRSAKNIFWLSGQVRENPRSSVVAELKPNGNFVIRYVNDPQNFIYQSFDYPTDTLLPGMKLGLQSESKTTMLNKSLISWKTSYDNPSSGNYVFHFRTRGSYGLGIMKGSHWLFWSGPWIGDRFGRLPRMFDLVLNNNDEPSCTFNGISNSSYSRLRLLDSGQLTYYVWNQSTTRWDMRWTAITDYCDIYNVCGGNSFCDLTSGCRCLNQYENRTDGCVRKTPFQCGETEFVSLQNMSFPYSLKSIQHNYINEVQECQQICVSDCKCSGFCITNSMQFTSSTCIIWREDLVDLRRYSNGGLTIYIKQGKNESNTGMIIGLSVGIPAAAALFSLAIYVFCFWKKKQNLPSEVEVSQPQPQPQAQPQAIAIGIKENQQVPALDFGMILQATETFSHEIGHGGYGVVYKGRLPDGREIAVKKLSNITTKGIVQFRDEGLLIASLQHLNLVRLYGWSLNENELVLVYEYLPNGSLDRHLFGRGQSSSELSWDTRYEITKGIARGLTSLHEDSQVMTIHRDLKPENILLHTDMVPKISDFGLGKTRHAVGTSGYMAPEYVVDGIYSTKLDVFSFGVMMLEIISGKQNTRFSYHVTDTNLLTFVWQKWVEGSWEEIVGEGVLLESSPSRAQQIRRYIGIGLLCVQQVADYRPKMSAVVAMLENEQLEVPNSKPPAFLIEQNPNVTYSSSSSSSSINQECTLTFSLGTVSEVQEEIKT